MEVKGRRAGRATGPILAPKPTKPAENPVVQSGPIEAAIEQPRPAEILAEAAKPAETALNVVAAAGMAASRPSIAPPAQEPKSAPHQDLPAAASDFYAAVAQSQAVLARGLEALSAEMAGLALSTIDNAARTATKLLGVKTLSDAIEVNAGFTCSSLQNWVSGSVTVSEIGVKLAVDSSRPMLSHLGKGWAMARGRNY
jgi:hypothetical protein